MTVAQGRLREGVLTPQDGQMPSHRNYGMNGRSERVRWLAGRRTALPSRVHRNDSNRD